MPLVKSDKKDYNYGMRLQKLDEEQQKPLRMPRGSLKMPDGRVLQPLLGYDIRDHPVTRKVMNQATRDSILDSKAWYYKPTRFIVSASLDNTPRFGVLLHLSMSYPDHEPTWAEIKGVRSLFFPSHIDVMMVLPKEEDYVNVHNFCYHLWQAPQAWDLL